MSSKNYGSVSVSTVLGDRIDAWCASTMDTHAELVDRAVLPVLNGEVPLTEVLRRIRAPAVVIAPTPPSELKQAEPRRKKREAERRVHAPNTICASCTREVGGQPYREMDHNGGVVALCVQCSDEPVRERSHLFGGSTGSGFSFYGSNRRNGPRK